MTALAAMTMGLLIGLSLGALGGGGSILTVPALVYVLGVAPRAATGQSLVLVGVTALAATIAHARAGHVRWGPGLAFGAAGLAASYAGSALNARLDPQLLLLAFAALMLAAATAMLAHRDTQQAPDRCPAPADARPTPGGQAAARGGVLTLAPPTPRPAKHRPSAAGVVKLLLAGSLVGFLTGLLGVGGGFVIVPVLVMALGYPMADAVGTSLLVIAVNSAAALLSRSEHMELDWVVLGPFLAASVAGSLAGHRSADRLPAAALKKAFATLLVLVAAYVAARAGTALIG